MRRAGGGVVLVAGDVVSVGVTVEVEDVLIGGVLAAEVEVGLVVAVGENMLRGMG